MTEASCTVTECVDVLLAKRKKTILSEAERHTVIHQAPCVLRLLLKRFMQVFCCYLFNFSSLHVQLELEK